MVFGLFQSELKAKDLIKMIKNPPSPYGGTLRYEDFYNKLKSVEISSQKWAFQEKSEFVHAAISSFEGMDGWVFISAESRTNIFELAMEEDESEILIEHRGSNKIALKCLALIAEMFPDVPETKRIVFILSEVRRIRERQRHPIYIFNPKPNIVFKDSGLKLAVVNYLMYEEGLLKPKFDLDLFAEEYKENISEFRGASPEAGKYILNLDIPIHFLHNIHTLPLETSANLYRKVCLPRTRLAIWNIPSYNSGGYVRIGDEAVNDLDFLPNLRKIKIEDEFETLTDLMSQNFLQALKAKRIKISHKEKNVSF